MAALDAQLILKSSIVANVFTKSLFKQGFPFMLETWK